MRRARLTYWSESPLSHKIRRRFGLDNPSALTLEEWDNHETICKEKAPFIHYITDKGFNKLQDIVMFPSDLYWNIKTASIWKFIHNLWVFRKALWNFRSWDYTGLLRLMEIASYEMHKCHKNHGHLIRSDDTAKELLIFSALCKRIREDEYTDDKQEFVKGKGVFGGSFVQKPNTLPSCKSKSFYKLCNRMKRNDMELLGKLISRKLDQFWD